MESTKSGQSKRGILAKACDYIQELRQSNHRLSEELQGLDQLQLDNDVLRQQVRPAPAAPPRLRTAVLDLPSDQPSSGLPILFSIERALSLPRHWWVSA